MIVIKIKTWKDRKKDFIDWVKEPRRRTCKEYVNYMEALERNTLPSVPIKEIYVGNRTYEVDNGFTKRKP